MSHGIFGDVAEENRGDGDAELRGGELAVQVLEGLLHRSRLAVAAPDHGFDPGAARGYQGELRGDEKRVRRDQDDHSEEAETQRLDGGWGRGHAFGRNLAAADSTSRRPTPYDSPVTSLPLEVHCVHRAPLRPESRRRLTLALGITAVVMVAEAVGGWLAGSLALLADAGHMLADGAALGLALFAAHVAQRPATAQRSFGLLRLEILAALANGALLIAIAVGIGLEAWRRLRAPPAVNAELLLGVAAVGLVANFVAVTLLHRGHQHSLNQRAAYLHVVGDLLGSVGALAAGAIVLGTGWTPADPLISIFIGALVLVSAWRLVKESTDVLLEATPGDIALEEVHDRILAVRGVDSVHDLHVWTVTSGVVAMSGHLVVKNPADNQPVLEAVQDRMRALGIHHVTVQMEREPTCD